MAPIGTSRLADDRNAQALLGLALALNQFAVYGPSHRVAIQAAEIAYTRLDAYLQEVRELVIALVDDALFVNDKSVAVTGPIERALLPAMAGLTLDSFTIESGLTRDEFVKLIETLAQSSRYKVGEVSPATFRRALEVAGIRHVHIQNVRYKRVREDEKVVAKTTPDESDEASEAPPPTATARRDGDTLADVLDRHDLAATARMLGKMLKQPEELSRLVLEALETPKNAEQVGAFLNQIAQAFETVFSELPDNPTAMRTAARRVEKLRRHLSEDAQRHPWVEGKRIKQLDGMLQAAADDLKVEVFAEEYRKRKQALEKSERQIARFIRQKSGNGEMDADLRERLGESGMSFAEWSGMTAAATPKDRNKKRSDAIDKIKHLADEFRETAAQASNETFDKVRDAADAAGKQLLVVTDELNGKINDLIGDLREEARPPKPGEKKKPSLSRKELFVKLAEIAQELCQPLSVITASVDMIAGNHLGDVNDCQLSMLKLAAEGAERMQKLIYTLMEIADVPEDVRPNQAVISSFY